ncbi:hypothetical protein GPECTOR_63g32 [Gonium pectorale]|uniref:ZIP protein n=1 Tax=Gonium pectorale TaxID=33097 RepID=A0A150G592_GONPE|nr:hypothetical protein GPECTOR_63g32 [Gonium pectorale]|eukprot:KXZ44705.1 hypothetical protein GPECTOR_63g32 [Gonium pectorale]
MSRQLLARSLLGGLDLPGEHDEHDEHEDGVHENTKPLRIAAIFIILATGLIGGFPPLFLKVFRDPDSTTTRLVRSFSAGVIAALALVHIIPEAVVEMIGLGGIEYPLGGTCVVFGVALMVLLEHTAHIMHGNGGAASVSALEAEQSTVAAGCAVPPASADVQFKTQASLEPKTTASGQLRQSSGEVGSTPAGHSHVCVSRGSASNWVAATAVEAVGSLRLKVVAGLFELGCIFHSFIIGLSLGVNQTDLTEVRSLLIALAFHQWLEGISLASVVIRGGFSTWKGAAMILTYSLTCPVGIAVGMGIAETYDEESERARGVQGAFNGVSGGMLLYISLVQLIAEDMGRLVPGRDSARSRLGAFVALCGGAASMCLLAVWA